jgi:hypothetical protein
MRPSDLDPVTKARLLHPLATWVGDLADSATRIPRYGYHLAGPVHRVHIWLNVLLRRWLKQAADDAVKQFEEAQP